MSENKKAIDHLEFNLPIGFKCKGAEFKTFELGAVKGKLRRDFFNLKKRSPGRETLTALKHVVTKLGNVDAPVESFFLQLPVPDIDYIYLCMNKMEGDNVIAWDFTCSTPDGDGCGTEMKLNIDPADVGLVEANPPIEYNEKGSPVQTVMFEDPITSTVVPITYKIPTLGDQIKMFDRMNANDANLGNFIFHQISSMMLDYNNTGRGLSVEELDDLPMATLDALLNQNDKYNPTQIDSELEIVCSNCGMKHEEVLPVDNWLVPFAPKTPSES